HRRALPVRRGHPRARGDARALLGRARRRALRRAAAPRRTAARRARRAVRMTAPRPGAGARAALLAAALLLASALATATARFASEEPIDFYHFWGIQAARTLATDALGGPYDDLESYAAPLNAAADASTDAAFRRTNARRRSLDPTSRPLAYALCAWLPADWGAARRLYVLAQLAAFAGGVWLFGRTLGLPHAGALVVAGAGAVAFVPLAQDLARG